MLERLIIVAPDALRHISKVELWPETCDYKALEDNGLIHSTVYVLSDKSEIHMCCSFAARPYF